MLLAALLVATAIAAPSDDYPKNPRIDIEHYRFQLGFTDADDTLRATATVTARFVAGRDSLLRLDLVQAGPAHEGRGMTVQWVGHDGVPLRFRHDGDVLWVNLGHATRPGELVTVDIEYRGRPADALRIGPNKYGDRTIFSDNWPNRARNWLPTVDHPYDKATSEMVVTAPAHYQVVSNGVRTEETDLGNGMRRTHWVQSVPIATWLYALGIAEFAVEYRPDCIGVPIQTWVYRQDRNAGFHDFATPTCDVLEFFSSRIGPYSYAKLANVVSPSVNGGMEAATAIFYGEPSVSGTRAVTWQNVIVHEIAHQWFGNAVTEGDWDDVWLSEGFATYFTLLFREHARGRDDFVAGLRDARERVRAFYAKTPDYRVVHDGLRDMAQVTNGMTYQKGAWTLHMLRERIGDEAFWQGIRRYYHEHRDANASTADFQRAMEQSSGQALGAFFDQWLRQGGIPALDVRWHFDRGAGEVVVTMTEQDSPYPFTVDVGVGVPLGDGTLVTGSATVAPGQPGVIRLAAKRRPDAIVVDPDTRLLATWAVAERR